MRGEMALGMGMVFEAFPLRWGMKDLSEGTKKFKEQHQAQKTKTILFAPKQESTWPWAPELDSIPHPSSFCSSVGDTVPVSVTFLL